MILNGDKYLVKPDELRKVCSPEIFEFRDTSELEPFAQIIGQDRAVKAVEFGLDVETSGYNIFVCGPSGCGKTTLVCEMVHKKAAQQSVPKDLCYVYNFEEPDHPVALLLDPGMGRKLSRDMDNLVEKVGKLLQKTFNSQDFELQRAEIMNDFYETTTRMYTEVEEFAKSLGFAVTRSQNGITTIPLIDGRPLSPEDYIELSEEKKNQLLENGRAVQERINEALRQYRELERALRSKIHRLEQETARRAIVPLFANLYETYRNYGKVIAYLEKTQADMLNNLELFAEEDENQINLIFFKRLDRRHALRKYKVNLIVDHSQSTHAPVVLESNPTFTNLFGSFEYEGEFGILATDFTKIKGGAVHKANGGYLILHFSDLLRNFIVWDTLKRILRNRQITIESPLKNLSLNNVETLQPEPVPLDLKVIIIGEPIYYYLLYMHEEDFPKLFKIKAEFDTEMDRNTDNIYRYAAVIADICRREGLRHFKREAIARLIDYSSWLADDQRKLSTMFSHIRDVVVEASAWAEHDNSKLVEVDHVEKAIQNKRYRSCLIEDKIMEIIKDGTLIIDVCGSRIGELNGLAVYMVGDHIFGKPSRITAKTFMGEKGVVNIEREVRMSGTIHNKGVLTLSGYLGSKYAQDKPLSLSASVTFEQTYEGIEGDSASGAELFAIISSLAEVPIKQGIAVTGSVNQNGEIQPIGGVNPKIEGFYRVCKIKGLTGEQGVIIPRQNVRNLMLDQEIVDAVRKGLFHIWAIDNVDQGIEILMGKPAGKLEKNGEFTRDSVHYLVNKKLKEWGTRYREAQTSHMSKGYRRGNRRI